MNRILLSIYPEFAEKILNGEKKWEFRKTAPEHGSGVFIMYATKPVGMIVGEFTSRSCYMGSPEEIWTLCGKKGGIDKGRFFEYFKNSKGAYAHSIKSYKKYDEPIALVGHPPKSWRCYNG